MVKGGLAWMGEEKKGSEGRGWNVRTGWDGRNGKGGTVWKGKET